MRGNSHARCGAGEKVESGAGAPLRPYLSLLIMVPVSAVSDERELVSMVRDINRTQVRSTEILSDNIYLYSPDSGKLTLIEN